MTAKVALAFASAAPERALGACRWLAGAVKLRPLERCEGRMRWLPAVRRVTDVRD